MGWVTRAIMYSQIMYWREVNQKPFYKTDKDWMDELGFNLSEVQLARKYLVSEWFVTVEFKRLAHNSMYDIVDDKFRQLIKEIYSIEYTEISETSKTVSGKWKNNLGKDEKQSRENEKEVSGEWEKVFDNIWTEITTETTTESVEVVDPSPPPAQNNLDYINWMRDVEKRGMFRLKNWNEKTWKSDLMNGEIKKAMYDIMKNVTADEFEKRVINYNSTVQTIDKFTLRSYVYYPIWDFDFLVFLSKINLFYGEIPTILSKIAKKEYSTKIVNMIKPKQQEVKAEQTEKKPMTDEERKEAVQKLREKTKQICQKTSF